MSEAFHTIPDAPPSDIVEWSRTCGIRVDGHAFNPDRIPQLIEPLRAGVDPTLRVGTLCKPVQSGGSTVGEIIMAFRLAFGHGFFQYNWPHDQKAAERWESRILPLLHSVDSLKWAGGRFDEKICIAKFLNAMLVVQGVVSAGALDSETVPSMINEEVHLWAPGTLARARARATLCWNSFQFDISNAGIVGDQLETAYERGSMEVWEVLCPGCKKYHVMQFRFSEKNPELGGLRFDTSAGRQSGGKYSLNKVVPTIRYQMPCGFIVHDTPAERRALIGRYRKTNDGALDGRRSWNYEAVSVSEIKWPELVDEWLIAIQALKNNRTIVVEGKEVSPMQIFVQQRECKFYSEESVPFSGMVVVNNMLTKSREGLAGHIMRAWFADKQKGYAHKGEFTHYWLVIRDVMANADSLLVFEGLVQTDEDLKKRLEEHGCVPASGAIDCGWDRANVLQLCYREGYNAQTTSAQDKLFFHPEEKAYRIYSVPEGLHKQLKVPPKFNYVNFIEKGKLEYRPSGQEPLHWNIHRIGSLKLLNFLRGHRQLVEKNGGADFIKWEVPGDASEDYKKQMESWEFSSKKKPGTNQVVEICKQRLPADHLLFCEAGIANLIAMAPHPEHPELSILSVRLAQMGITDGVVGQGETAKTEDPK